MKLKQNKETVEVFKQKFMKRVRETLLREDTPGAEGLPELRYEEQQTNPIYVFLAVERMRP